MAILIPCAVVAWSVLGLMLLEKYNQWWKRRQRENRL